MAADGVPLPVLQAAQPHGHVRTILVVPADTDMSQARKTAIQAKQRSPLKPTDLQLQGQPLVLLLEVSLGLALLSQQDVVGAEVIARDVRQKHAAGLQQQEAEKAKHKEDQNDAPSALQ